MGNEISEYIAAVRTALDEAYGQDWNILLRGQRPYDARKALQVQLSIQQVDIVESGYETKARVTAAADIVYLSKAATHGSWFQSVDIAATLGVYLHDTVIGEGEPVVGAPPQVELIEVLEYGEPTGIYSARLSWMADMPVDVNIDIPGYTTTSPPSVFDRRTDPPHDPNAPLITDIEVDERWLW